MITGPCRAEAGGRSPDRLAGHFSHKVHSVLDGRSAPGCRKART
ncbi:hypothetical protein [Streptomyces spectabilis]|uniref:Uncharacterized protein n=1 Tax=Streptomyces spectabilis TaxID=68270 RepID=A0A7W8AXM2_STRST|nr:hypothetical protein [Streptomyces spectabilis]MBB5105305.1 hypothetical protein [Streptomyces spectabilis]